MVATKSRKKGSVTQPSMENRPSSGSTAMKEVRRIVELAGIVEADIRTRGLKPGDRYLTTVETARMLRADSTIANRALQALVKRNVLERRQRVGTVVARVDAETPSPLEVVRIIIRKRISAMESGLFDSGVLLGFHNALSGIRVQLESVPEWEIESKIPAILEQSLRMPNTEGFVLAHSTMAMQRMFAQSGLPTVIFGHPYSSVSNLPFVDRDMTEVGAVTTRYVLQQGCKQVLLMLGSNGTGPGDYKLGDAVRDTVYSAGLPGPALTMRNVPEDREAIRDMVTAFLANSSERPAILAGTTFMADVVVEVIEGLGLKVQRDVVVVAEHYFNEHEPKRRYAVTRPTLDFPQQGACIGRMLKQLAAGEAPNPHHVLIPVVLDTGDQA